MINQGYWSLGGALLGWVRSEGLVPEQLFLVVHNEPSVQIRGFSSWAALLGSPQRAQRSDQRVGSWAGLRKARISFWRNWTGVLAACVQTDGWYSALCCSKAQIRTDQLWWTFDLPSWGLKTPWHHHRVQSANMALYSVFYFMWCTWNCIHCLLTTPTVFTICWTPTVFTVCWTPTEFTVF